MLLKNIRLVRRWCAMKNTVLIKLDTLYIYAAKSILSCHRQLILNSVKNDSIKILINIFTTRCVDFHFCHQIIWSTV